jgi:hypothetical protein
MTPGVGPVGVSIVPAAAPTGKRRYRVSVTAPADGKAVRGSDSIILRTDHPNAGEVAIPVVFAARHRGDPAAGSSGRATEATR